MELKPRYKQTEVGVIPEEWDIDSLGSVCDVRDGTHESPRFFRDGVPFVTSKNIVGGRLDLENVSYISKSDASEFDKRSKVDRNDILLSMIGTIGSATLVDCEPNFSIKNVALLKPRKALPAFLVHLINSPLFQRHLKDNLDGGIQKFVSLGTLRKLSITLPDDREQRAIAEALSDVDALLSGLDRLIAKKRDLKQAAMQQLLTGQTRLPGFSGEWEVKMLGDLLEQIGDGATPSTADRRNYGGGIPWVVIEDIKDEITTTETTLTEHGLRACAAKLWEPGTLILSTGATIGEVGITRIPVATKQGICGLIVDRNEATPEFLKYWFTHNKASLLSKAQGSTIKEVRAPTLVKFELLIPSVPEQAAIATVLSDMDAEIAVLEQRRDKTRALKQAMMQELLTGRTRLV